VEFLFNDLSMEMQFADVAAFRAAISRLMTIRRVIRSFGRDLYCHREFAAAWVTPSMAMPQAVGSLAADERRAVMQWLTRYGPFWDEARIHAGDEYLECCDRVVTDHAIGEAAYSRLSGVERELVSIEPSSWQFSPLSVSWVRDTGESQSIDVPNYWRLAEIEAALRATPPTIASWSGLEELARTRFQRVSFANSCFRSAMSYPFVLAAALRIVALLDVLNRTKGCFDDKGQRTREGHDLYRDFFTGKRAWFSDSSDSEKQQFREVLTFEHPERAGVGLFCSWHGKVNTPKWRVHFSFPITADGHLWVVYVGPKLTKQ
jgi:hypothetical protein